jgi:hypothetical protein
MADLLVELEKSEPSILLMLGAGDFDQFLPKIVEFFSTKSLKL